MFLSFTFDSLRSCGSSDVFTGFLARSVQDLWLIKFKGHRLWPACELRLCLPVTTAARDPTTKLGKLMVKNKLYNIL